MLVVAQERVADAGARDGLQPARAEAHALAVAHIGGLHIGDQVEVKLDVLARKG